MTPRAVARLAIAAGLLKTGTDDPQETLRVVARLAIAAGLLKTGTDDPQETLRVVEALPEVEREHLRGLVDWVEDYDRHL